jgi:hypothetical protein
MNFHGPFRMLRRRCCAVYNNLPRKFRASNYKSMHEKLLSSSLYPFRTISCPSMRFTHIRCDPPLFALRRRPFSTGIKRILKRDRSKWTLDDILAMGSWFFVGNTVFVLLATTSSVSLLLFIVNSLQFQGILFGIRLLLTL